MKSLLVMLGMVFALVSCADDKGTGTGDGSSANRAVVEAQIQKDFKDLGTINVSAVKVERGYEVATFTIAPAIGGSIDTLATTTKNMTAWYEVTNATATIKKDVEDLGTTMPTDLDTAFKATLKYSDATLWTVTEVEIDTQTIAGVKTKVYEVELVNQANAQLEAELYYNFSPVELLYSKETLDADDNEDKVVIDDALITAVKVVYPSPAIVQVIDAEMEGTQIEVEVRVTSGTPAVTTENEILFNVTGTGAATTYTVASQENEVKVAYSAILPTELKTAIDAWFTANVTTVAETPVAGDIVEVTTITTGTGDTAVKSYEVDMEYINTAIEYEVELEINATFKVTKAEAEVDGEDVVVVLAKP